MRTIFESNMLYSDEHFSCSQYVRDTPFGFCYKEYPLGSFFTSESLRANVVIILLSGTMNYNCCLDGVHQLSAGQMLFMPIKTMCDLEFSENTAFVQMAFEKSNFVCQPVPLHSLSKLVNFIETTKNELPINDQMQAFIDLLLRYLRNGISCAAFHQIKIDEFFILLRHFYSKEQLAAFFSPVLNGASQEFRMSCLNLRATSHNITEMVERSGMSKTKFYSEFRKEFGDVNPKKWFDSYMDYKILHEVSKPGATVKDLAFRFEFESESAFAQYCHRHFGYTAAELIKKRRAGTILL